MKDRECKSLLLDLDSYVERSLPPEELAAYDEHIACCKPCMEMVSNAKSVIGLLREAKRARVPKALDEAVRIGILTRKMPVAKAPPALDSYIKREIRDFAWLNSRRVKVLRAFAGFAAMAASVFLCAGIWLNSSGNNSSMVKIRTIVVEEKKPLSWWIPIESTNQAIHTNVGEGRGTKNQGHGK